MLVGVFEGDKDWALGKVVKKTRTNPPGEDVFLCADGWSITKDEDKIVAIQRLWKHEYYKPGGKGFLKAIDSYNASQ